MNILLKTVALAFLAGLFSRDVTGITILPGSQFYRDHNLFALRLRSLLGTLKVPVDDVLDSTQVQCLTCFGKRLRKKHPGLRE